MSHQFYDITPPKPPPHDYDRQTSFKEYERENPDTIPRGVDLDAEFDHVERALDETQSRLRMIQRDDGTLRSALVGEEQFDADTRSRLDRIEETARTGADIGMTLESLTGQIRETHLFESLAGRIDLIDGDGPGSVTARLLAEAQARADEYQALNDAILAEAQSRVADIQAEADARQALADTIQAEIADITGLAEFDPNVDYGMGDAVRFEGRLYRALQDLTAPAPYPTDTAYWDLIGEYASISDAVAAQAVTLTEHNTRITGAEGSTQANADSIQALQASVADADTRLSTKATLTQLDEAVASLEGAEVSRFTNIAARFDSVDADLAGKASITALQQAISDESQARASDYQNLDAKIEGEEAARQAAVTTLQQAIADESEARAGDYQNLQAQIGQEADRRQAAVTTLQEAVSTESSARATAIEELEARIGGSEDEGLSAQISDLRDATVDENIAQAIQFAGARVRHSTNRVTSSASVEQYTDAFATESQARAEAFQSLNAKIEGEESTRQAAVSGLQQAIIDESEARAAAIEQTNTQLNGLSATVETRAESWDGVAAQWSVKTDVGELNADGEYRVGGIGLYNDGVKTRVYIQADQFAIYDSDLPQDKERVIPFTFQGGRTYIKNAAIANAAIDSAKIKDLAVDTLKIGDKAVTFDKLDDLSVGTAKIRDAAITNAKIQNAAITTAKIGSAQITHALIANAAIRSANIAEAAIGNAHIADLNVDKLTGRQVWIKEADIEDAAITRAKIGTAEVDTLNLRGEAVTVPRAVYGVDQSTTSSSWQTVMSISVPVEGEVSHLAVAFKIWRTDFTFSGEYRVLVNGSQEFFRRGVPTSGGLSSARFEYLPFRVAGGGIHSYVLQYRKTGDGSGHVHIGDASMFAMGVKR